MPSISSGFNGFDRVSNAWLESWFLPDESSCYGISYDVSSSWNDRQQGRWPRISRGAGDLGGRQGSEEDADDFFR